MILYKYYPLNENSFRSLSVGGLWCHFPSEMNDPLECLAGFPIAVDGAQVSHFLKELSGVDPVRAEKLRLAHLRGNNVFFETARDHLIKKFAFCALSEEPDNLLMWSHYANQHRGCVIGLQFDDDLKGNLLPVEYTDRTEPVPLDCMLETWRKDKDGSQSSEDAVRRLFANLSRKASCWKYEREWRVWRTSPQYYRYQPADIVDVYFGVRCPKELRLR